MYNTCTFAHCYQSCQARVFMRNFMETHQAVPTYEFPPIFMATHTHTCTYAHCYQSCQAHVIMRNFMETQQAVRTYKFPPIFTAEHMQVQAPEVCACAHTRACIGCVH